MPTELSLSQPATEGRGDVTVAYIGGREVQPVGSGVPSGATQPSSHLQLEAAVQGSCEVSASATTLVVSRRERVQEEEEKEEVKEPDRFITLAELTTNKLSEAGVYTVQ